VSPKSQPFESPIFTGLQVNYYFVCQRKLWLFSSGIQMEAESDQVLLGHLLTSQSFPRREKEIAIDQTIVIDFFDYRDGVVHEVKKSRAIEKAHIWQVLYYLYYLKRKGVQATGEINYPLLRRRERVELTPDREEQMDRILEGIAAIVQQPLPPARREKRFCRKCAYFELCWG